MAAIQNNQRKETNTMIYKLRLNKEPGTISIKSSSVLAVVETESETILVTAGGRFTVQTDNSLTQLMRALNGAM